MKGLLLSMKVDAIKHTLRKAEKKVFMKKEILITLKSINGASGQESAK